MSIHHFDEVFDIIGGFGAYQISLFVLLGTICFFNAFHLTGMIMLGATVDHWCHIPSLRNFSHVQQKYIAIPWDDDSDSYSSCGQFDLDYENYTQEELWTWDRVNRTYGVDTVKCQQWTYDQSLFVENAVTKFDLVCDDSHLVPLTSSIFQVGVLVGALVSGYLSDRYGRRPVLHVGSMLFMLGSFVIILSPTYWVFTTLRFLISVAQYLAYLGSFVILIEVTGTRHRTIVGTVYNMWYSVGYITVAVMGYYIRDYNNLCITWAVPLLLSLLFFFVVPESPRWLASMGRYKQSEATLREIAAVNGREISGKPLLQNHDVIQEVPIQAKGVNADKPILAAEDISNKKADIGNFWDIFRSSVLRKEMIIIYIGWFGNNLLFHGLSLNTGALPGNIFLNTLLMAGVEIPGVLVGVTTMFYLGRRPTVCGGLMVAGAANLLCIPFIGKEDFNWMVTVLALLSKGAIKLAFISIMVYTGELFPTPVRHLAIGSSSMISRVGGIIAPYMGEPLVSVWEPLPSLLFAISALVPGLLCLLLPETLNKPLPDTFQEAEDLARFSKKKQKKGQLTVSTETTKVDCVTENTSHNDKTISTRL